MWALFLENCRYVLRSKMVVLVILFSTLVHLSGLKLINHLTVSIQEVVTVMGPKEAIRVGFYIQLFTALSIASVYGVWMAPYAHRGERSLLTHVLPVSKVYFPLCYGLCCGLLLIINEVILLMSFGWVMGFSFYSSDIFPWGSLIKTCMFQTLCLEVLMLSLALSSLVVGQINTVFLGATSLFVMQILGTFSHFFSKDPKFSLFTFKGLFVFVYEKLPPIGDFIFDFNLLSKGESVSFENLGLWLIWWLIICFLFVIKIRYPSNIRGSEG